MKISLLISLVAVLMGAQSAPPQKDVPAIAKSANGAVVSIIMSDKDGQPVAQGSGFIVSNDGLIVTNYHVIAEGTSAVVKLPDGAFYIVDGVLALDKSRDIAIIKAHGQDLKTLALGNSDRVQVGEEVVAIGNPLSLESTVSNGILSGIRTDEDLGGKFLQVTTPISPGSSGGPLFNMAGEVIGVTTMYLKGGENLNFATPINDAKRLLLAKFSKLQDLPNKAEPVKAQTPDRDAPSSQSLTDRDYYKQLYDAGGFFKSIPVMTNGKPDVSTTLERRYVCFNDDTHSGEFFAFDAFAYDETYAKAFDKTTQIMFTKDWRQDPEKVEEFQKASNAEREIQNQWPYVSFLGDDFFQPGLPADLQKFFRQGGRVLDADFYSKGVKSNTAEYHWDGNSWVLQYGPEDPNASVKSTRTFRLSIEPTTLRYAEILTVTLTTGSGDEKISSSKTVKSSSGVCEEIPDKR